MIIISPKTEFLAGALISTSHIARLFPTCKLYTWKKRSRFLDVNKITYEVMNESTTLYIEDPILVTDMFVDHGYGPIGDVYNNFSDWEHLLHNGPNEFQIDEFNLELYKYLSRFDKIIFCNHQPFSKCIHLVVPLLSMLFHKNRNIDITILNYRASWNWEFENLIHPIFPSIKYGLLPYHYYYFNNYNYKFPDRINSNITLIGRTNSKCKLQYKCDELKKVCEVDSISPDNEMSNFQFIKKLAQTNSSFIGTGYYYSGEGNPEISLPFNKLEWSLIDSMMAGRIPITSSLFAPELYRIGIKLPLISYMTMDIDSINEFINEWILTDSANINDYRERLKKELNIGNNLMSHIINP
jgi:hypothetical protein